MPTDVAHYPAMRSLVDLYESDDDQDADGYDIVLLPDSNRFKSTFHVPK